MGDRTTAELTFRADTATALCQASGASDLADLLDADSVDSVDGEVTLERYEANYGEMPDITDALEALGVEYYLTWNDGGEYGAGARSHRLNAGGGFVLRDNEFDAGKMDAHDVVKALEAGRADGLLAEAQKKVERQADITFLPDEAGKPEDDTVRKATLTGKMAQISAKARDLLWPEAEHSILGASAEEITPWEGEVVDIAAQLVDAVLHSKPDMPSWKNETYEYETPLPGVSVRTDTTHMIAAAALTTLTGAANVPDNVNASERILEWCARHGLWEAAGAHASAHASDVAEEVSTVPFESQMVWLVARTFLGDLGREDKAAQSVLKHVFSASCEHDSSYMSATDLSGDIKSDVNVYKLIGRHKKDISRRINAGILSGLAAKKPEAVCMLIIETDGWGPPISSDATPELASVIWNEFGAYVKSTCSAYKELSEKTLSIECMNAKSRMRRAVQQMSATTNKMPRLSGNKAKEALSVVAAILTSSKNSDGSLDMKNAESLLVDALPNMQVDDTCQPELSEVISLCDPDGDAARMARTLWAQIQMPEFPDLDAEDSVDGVLNGDPLTL